MSKFLKSYWMNRVELPPIDMKRLQYFIREELTYYNALVGAFAGPIRSMPETFAKTHALETILALVAETGTSLRSLRADTLKDPFARIKGSLFDETGKMIIDDRSQFIAEVLASPGKLDKGVRREMALGILRECRRQSKALQEGTTSIIEVLMPIEAAGKRHVQLPRSSAKVKETKEDVIVTLPYFETVFTVPKPTASWNHIYVRLHHDGAVTLDLAFEDVSYVLRKVDRAPKQVQKVPHLSRRGRMAT